VEHVVCGRGACDRWRDRFGRHDGNYADSEGWRAGVYIWKEVRGEAVPYRGLRRQRYGGIARRGTPATNHASGIGARIVLLRKYTCVGHRWDVDGGIGEIPMRDRGEIHFAGISL